jgi:hypothetical protein
MKTKNNKPSSEFAHEDKCPSCGSPCNIHTDLDDNDECNDCRNQIDTLEMGQIIPKEEPKQETPEEGALKWFVTANKNDIIFDLGWVKIFEAGAKWQQEQNKNLYSEEEVKDMLINISNYINTKELKDNSNTNFDEWVRKRNWFITYLIQQFKK